MSLCYHCKHRRLSQERVQIFIQAAIARGDTPPYRGMVADPTPKAECKRHEGYGYRVESRDVCGDFEEDNNGKGIKV